MTAQLTADQSRALSEDVSEHLQLIDPETSNKYILVPEAEYIRLTEASLETREAYRAVERAFAEGWDDPKLDDYDRYDELRK